VRKRFKRLKILIKQQKDENLEFVGVEFFKFLFLFSPNLIRPARIRNKAL